MAKARRLSNPSFWVTVITLSAFSGFFLDHQQESQSELWKVLVGSDSPLRVMTVVAILFSLFSLILLRVHATREKKPANLMLTVILLASATFEAWILLSTASTSSSSSLQISQSWGAVALALGLLTVISVAACLAENKNAFGKVGYRLTLITGLGLSLAIFLTALDLSQLQSRSTPSLGPHLGGTLSLLLTATLLNTQNKKGQPEPLFNAFFYSLIPLIGAGLCDYLALHLNVPHQIVTGRALVIFSHGVLICSLLVQQIKVNQLVEAQTKELSHHSDLLQLTAEINRIIADQGELQSLLKRVTRVLIKHCNVSLAQIWIRNENTEMIELKASAGSSIPLNELDGKNSWIFNLGFIIQEQRHYITNDLLNDNFLAKKDLVKKENINALAATPLVLEGRVLGVITLFNTQPFKSEFVETLHSLNNSIALGIQRKMAFLGERANEESLINITNSVPVLISLVNDDERIVFANATHTQWFGKEQEEIIGHPLQELLGTHAYKLIEPEIDQALEGVRCQFESSLPFDPDNPMFVRGNLIPKFNSEGATEGFFCLMTDLTDIHDSEIKLEEARKMAEESNRLKSDFLANMSHELRTPMTAIIGYSEEVLEQLAQGEQQEMVATILNNGQYLLELMNDILDLSKVESGKLEIERIECDLPSVCQSVYQLMEGRATQKGIELKIVIDSDIPDRIVSDPTRLRQILINFIGNAIKFTHEGEVKLVLKTSMDRSKIIFRVQDTGIGMDKEQMDRLFKPFTQADASISRKFGGTGLGLTICKLYAELMEGKIEVESAQEIGSTFKIILPNFPAVDAKWISDWDSTIQKIKEEEVSSKGNSESKNTFPAKILVAEDNLVNQKLVQRILTKMGTDVELVENGQLAFERALEEEAEGTPFDIIFMDMRMPVLDGYQATSKLRERGYKGTIVALTANAMSGEQDKCLSAGCDAYASKPIKRPELIKILTQYTPSEVPA